MQVRGLEELAPPLHLCLPRAPERSLTSTPLGGCRGLAYYFPPLSLSCVLLDKCGHWSFL